VFSLSSCSRMERPGDFEPDNQPSIDASTDWRVYAGLLPMAQSPESSASQHSNKRICRNTAHPGSTGQSRARKRPSRWRGPGCQRHHTEGASTWANGRR
jgi:hypothetical protein